MFLLGKYYEHAQTLVSGRQPQIEKEKGRKKKEGENHSPHYPLVDCNLVREKERETVLKF